MRSSGESSSLNWETKTYVFRNEVSEFAAVAFDSRQSTVVRLKQLFEETGSTYAAINRYLEERRKKHE